MNAFDQHVPVDYLKKIKGRATGKDIFLSMSVRFEQVGRVRAGNNPADVGIIRVGLNKKDTSRPLMVFGYEEDHFRYDGDAPSIGRT